jgi:hypothetical protein
VGCDYYFGDVVFTSHYDNTNPALNGTEGRYESKGPLTLGVHGSAIPMRFRDAPVTLKARVNFPIPYLQRKCESRSVDWEISAGLRPAIWDTSLYGYGHFNFSFEAGFRSIDMSGSASRTGGSAQASYTPVSGQIDYRAKWEGAFLQLGLAF